MYTYKVHMVLKSNRTTIIVIIIQVFVNTLFAAIKWYASFVQKHTHAFSDRTVVIYKQMNIIYGFCVCCVHVYIMNM